MFESFTIIIEKFLGKLKLTLILNKLKIKRKNKINLVIKMDKYIEGRLSQC